MAKQKHTPGPRTVVTTGNVFGPNGRLVASCGGWDDGDPSSHKENMANARLDAAAPELLEACKAALGELTEGPCEIDDCTHDKCATAKLRAAIAKAESS